MPVPVRLLALLIGGLGVVVAPTVAHAQSASTLALATHPRTHSGDVPTLLGAHPRRLSGYFLPLVGAQPDSLLRRFDAANEAYTQGRYEQAVEDYRAVLDAGYASGALYHNLGNAYVRLDRVGPAVWAYERGRRLRPSDPRLRHNLEYVRRREGLPLGGLPPRGFAALVVGWASLFLFGLGWLVFGVGLVAAVFRTDPGEWVEWRRLSVWGPVSVGLMLVVAALGASYLQTHDRRAVVVVEQASIRPVPDEAAAPDTTVEGGTMVEVRTRESQWTRVGLRDQTAGWLPAQALGDVQ